jgi:putative addiction module component (TIGR02574 family)
MSEAAEKLKPVLATLTASERAEVVEYLLELGDAEEVELTQAEWETEWLEEANRRLEDTRTGKTVGIPADEFMKQMKEKYG